MPAGPKKKQGHGVNTSTLTLTSEKFESTRARDTNELSSLVSRPLPTWRCLPEEAGNYCHLL